MNDYDVVVLPKNLANVVDAYYQTRAFSLKTGAKFNKDLILAQLQKVAKRFRYTVEGTTGSFKFKGAKSTLMVTQDTYPNAIRTRN